MKIIMVSFFFKKTLLIKQDIWELVTRYNIFYQKKDQEFQLQG